MNNCAQCGISVGNPIYYLTPEINEPRQFYDTQNREIYCSALCSLNRTHQLRQTLKNQLSQNKGEESD